MTTTKVEFQVYTQRWYMLISYSILSCSSAWIWITWAPVAIHLTEMWNVSLSAVDALSGVYMYVYVPGSFIALYLVVNHLGLRNGLLVGAIFNCVGACIRYTAYQNYDMVYIGTLLCAVAQTFTLSTPPLIAGTWFGANERGMATSLGILANQLGTGLGLGATAVLDIIDTTTTASGQLDEDMLYRYLLFQFIVTCVAFFAVFISAKDQPPTPPNAAAYFMRYGSIPSQMTKECQKDGTEPIHEKRPLILPTGLETIKYTGDSQNMNFNRNGVTTNSHPNDDDDTHVDDRVPTYYESLCILTRDFSSMSFVLCFGLTVGVYYAVPTFLSQLMPNSWSTHAVGWLGVIYQFLGVIGSFLSGIMIDVTKQYRKINLICLLLSFIFLLGYYVTTYVDGIFVGTIGKNVIGPLMIAGAGASLSAFNTAGIDLGTGITFPADDAAVAGILESAAELNGFLCVTIGGMMTDSIPTTTTTTTTNSSSPSSPPSPSSSSINTGANEWITLLLTSVVAFSLLLLLITKTDMKRPI